MRQEQPRDGFTAREMYLMRQAFEAGIGCAQAYPEPGSMDEWLDEDISDGGHYVAQKLIYDVNRLYSDNKT